MIAKLPGKTMSDTLGDQITSKNTVKYTVKKLQLTRNFQLKKLNYFNLYNILREKECRLTIPHTP
jgi:hypothetical protein